MKSVPHVELVLHGTQLVSRQQSNGQAQGANGAMHLSESSDGAEEGSSRKREPGISEQ